MNLGPFRTANTFFAVHPGCTPEWTFRTIDIKFILTPNSRVLYYNKFYGSSTDDPARGRGARALARNMMCKKKKKIHAIFLLTS